MKITKIKKRDGSIVNFDKEKIKNAIFKACLTVYTVKDSENISKLATTIVLDRLKKTKIKGIPTVENIQDIVESALVKLGYERVAKNYILYRHERDRVRKVKTFIGVKDELKLPLNAIQILERRYLLRNDKQEIIESPGQLFQRVARAVGSAEKKCKNSPYSYSQLEEKFYYMMRALEFLPNSPTLMNAGTPMGQLSACFVLPVEDSIESIFSTLKSMAQIHQTGGGTGFSFSNLRPKGDLVNSTKGTASGPLSFMRIFSTATSVIVQGGRRRGANMGILRCDHPDILEFIEAKNKEGEFTNFNLSVAITDRFMDAFKKNKDFNLINPRTKKIVIKLSAKEIFEHITHSAWRTGDPGLVFIDRINRYNPTPELGPIESTNPCGELPLLPYESCNLGSINLAKIVKKEKVDWDRLKELVWLGVRFLDNVIEINRYTLPEIENITKANRKIGLGVMGFSDMLIQLGIPYSSNTAILWAKRIMKFISKESHKASERLANERGVFPNFKKSIYYKKHPMRNATCTTVAPTGTISIIADCSSGIEPIFAVSYIRNVIGGPQLIEVNPYFEKIAHKNKFYSEDLMLEIAQRGTIRNMGHIPVNIRRLFATALDINPIQHLRIQSSFQLYTDNSVSKTINLPASASPVDIKNIYLEAYRLRCKGITIYRYGTKKGQILEIGSLSLPTGRFIQAHPEYSGGCLATECHF